MGGFICLDKNMKPIEEMDKHVHFTGSNNDPDNPEVSPFSGVRKVWDQKRGCYVWKNIYTGDFLGTDKSSVHQQEKANQKGTGKETTQQKQNTGKKDQPKQNTTKKDQQNSQQQVGKQEQPKGKSNVETNNTTEELIITTDEQLRQAEAALKEAKAAVAYAKAHYPVDESRIYSIGYSFGGFMSSRNVLAHPEIFAGVGMGGMLFAGHAPGHDLDGQWYEEYT